nr:hypothetical protein DEQ67_15375 [Haloferax sp. Atlit-48N]
MFPPWSGNDVFGDTAERHRRHSQQVYVASRSSLVGVASGGPASMEDHELENRVGCPVAWLVDEDPFVGDGNHVGANLRASASQAWTNYSVIRF